VSHAASPSQWEPPALEVADIFRARGEAYRECHPLSAEQRAVMRDIETCRTSVLGGHVDVCDACGFTRPAYNSCRNRHCPKCQGLAQARWIDQRKERIIPTHYFHVVVTLPALLRPLARRNAKTFYDLLFQTVSKTLLELGKDPGRLGAQMGFTAVLHTWSRDLHYHPHIHCIVAGGGLSFDSDRWIPARRKYLFPVKVIAALFRGKFLARLREIYDSGELDLSGKCAPLAVPGVFQKLLDQLYRTKWVVYAKRPFGGPEQVYAYLGRYTHRIGLSNRRLVSFDGEHVCFRTRDGKTVTIPAEEFIQRFLQHVLPAGFVKIRHYGLLASGNAKTKLPIARRLLELQFTKITTTALTASVESADWREFFKALTGIDLLVCPRCRQGKMIPHPLYRSDEPPDTS
jgi:hypothetical protein